MKLLPLLLFSSCLCLSQGVSKAALHAAARRGDYDTVVTLIESGANIDAVNSRGLTPLFLAVLSYCENSDVIDYLLEKGANPNIDASKANGYTVLHHVMRPCKNADVENQKLRRFLTKLTDQESDLQPIQEVDRVDIIQKLADHQADVNARNVKGETPLHLAAEGALFREYRCLVAAGADPKSVDNDGALPACRLVNSFLARAESQRVDELTLLHYLEFLSYLHDRGHMDEHCVSMFSPGSWSSYGVPAAMILALYEDDKKDWKSTKLLIGRLNNARQDMRARRLIMARLPDLSIAMSVPVFLKFLNHPNSLMERISRDQLHRIALFNDSEIPVESTKEEWTQWFQANKDKLDQATPINAGLPAMGLEVIRGYKILFGKDMSFYELGNHCMTVRQVLADSSADAAGVVEGDVVVEINNRPIGGMLISEFINHLSGPIDSEVDMVLQTKDGKNRIVRVKREVRDGPGDDQ